MALGQKSEANCFVAKPPTQLSSGSNRIAARAAADTWAIAWVLFSTDRA